MAPTKSQYRPPAIVSEVQKKWEASKSDHDSFCRRYQRNEEAYKGLLRPSSDAAKWRHKHAPRYGFNLLETVISNNVEMGLRFDVRPAPHVDVPLEDALKQLSQAEAVADLLRHEHRIDEMDFKQRPFYLTAGIGGRGIMKTGWNYITGATRRKAYGTRDIHDDEGNVVLQVPSITEIEEQGILRDHSTAEVIHPCDFVVQSGAQHLDPFLPGGAQHVFNRCWYSFEQLKAMEAAGYVKNVDLLKETKDYAVQEYKDRAKEIWSGEDADVIEVLEYWCFRKGAVHRCLIGNRVVLLRGDDPENPSDGLEDLERTPFWHGGYPFVVGSAMPNPFTTVGTSEIELIADIQSILWEIGNQTLDNVELINNFILLIRSDVDDPDAWQHYPGARWETEGDVRTAAMPLQPPYQLGDVALKHMAVMRGDMQNITGAAPFAGGTETATVDQKTATGASIVMSAAQQRMLFKKWCAQQALRQEANLRIKNCQQFLPPSKLVHIIGPDGAMAFREISVLDIQGDFVAELEPMGESMMREQKRAESMQFFSTLMQAAPLAAAAGAPLNIRELVGWMAKKWDILDWERFMSQQAPSLGAAAAPGGPGGGQGQSSPPGDQNMGITADTAVSASSPSATGGNSLSGEQMLARALSMNGGTNQ